VRLLAGLGDAGFVAGLVSCVGGVQGVGGGALLTSKIRHQRTLNFCSHLLRFSCFYSFVLWLIVSESICSYLLFFFVVFRSNYYQLFILVYFLLISELFPPKDIKHQGNDRDRDARDPPDVN